MYKIAVYLDNRHIPSIDFQNPELGNPGVGACEYLHTAIPYFINKYCGNSIRPIILAHHIENMPENIEVHQVNSIINAADSAKALNCDFFLFRPRQNEEENILDHIDNIELPSIGRAAFNPSREAHEKNGKV